MKFIPSIKQKPWQSVCTSIIIGLIIFYLASIVTKLTLSFFPENIQPDFYLKNIPLKIFIAIFSLTAILLFNEKSLKGYGFQQSINTKYPRLVLTTLIATYASMIVGGILFLGICNHFFPTDNTKKLPNPESMNDLLKWILAIWIFSSICEEILVRGFIQGFIQHLKHIKIFKLSLPVFISGLFFGCMHLFNLIAGLNLWYVLFQFTFTTTLGMVAAHYREKSDSIIPAIWVHIIGNIFGSLPMLITMLLK